MKREELLKRTKQELLTLAGEKGKRLSAKLRKVELVDQVLALFSARRERTAKAKAANHRATRPRTGATAVATPTPAKRKAAEPRTVRATPRGPDQARLRDISAEISAGFPIPFERTEIILYEVDPFHGHTFWHVRLDHLEDARRSHGHEGEHAPLLLRFYDVTLIDFNGSNANYHFDVAVHSLLSNYYVEFWESGRSYIVDIGLGLPDGRFHTIARSNHIELPPHAPSDNYDRTGLVVDPQGRIVCEVADVTRAHKLADICPEPNQEMPADASEELVRTFYRQLTDEGLSAPSEPRRRRLNAEGVSAAGAPAPASETSPQTGGTVEGSGEPQQTLAVLRGTQRASAEATEWPLVKEAPSGGYPRSDPGGAGSYEIAMSVPARSDLSSHALFGQSGVGRGVSSWVTSPGAWGPSPAALQSVFTFAPRDWKREGRVNEADAELVIQGWAKPGSELTLLDQPVTLRPDGTFSIRWRLPEGTIMIPIAEAPEASPREDGEGGAS